MASQLSQSSVATVVEDLVADRNIALKVCMIVLNTLQILSSWVAAVVFIINSQTKYGGSDYIFCLAFLLIGSYLIPGITNGVIYYLRWSRSSVTNRSRMQEENKQAWVCLRITLTLIGLPTVGRYIETITVSNKLSKLEKEHMHSSVASQKETIQLHPVVSGSRLGSVMGGSASDFAPHRFRNSNSNLNNNNNHHSSISGLSHQSSLVGMSDNSYRKVRRARRQYKRCEHDGALMALVAGSAGSGPFAVIIGFIYLQRLEKIAPTSSETGAMVATFILSLLWLNATLTQFYPARHVQSEAQFERGIRSNNMGALVLLYCSHMVQTTTRVIILSVFANWFYAYVLLPVGLQWLVGTISFVVYRLSMRPKTVGAPAGQRVSSQCRSALSAVYYGFVGIFDFVNGNEGKTRLRYLVYYGFYFAENVAMLVIWIVLFPNTQIHFPIPFVCVLLALFWVGFALLQVYLYYFSQSPYGSSVIGLCHRGSSGQGDVGRRGSHRYAEEVRDPVFGVTLSESAIPITPTSRQKQHQAPPSSRLSHQQQAPLSILSSKSPMSIMSTGPQPLPAPINKNRLPPIPQAAKETREPSSKRPEFMSESDSDSDSDSPVYQARKPQKALPPVVAASQRATPASSVLHASQSHPDLSPSLPSSNERSHEAKAQFRPGPILMPSHSLENVAVARTEPKPPRASHQPRTRPITTGQSGKPPAKYRPSNYDQQQNYHPHRSPHRPSTLPPGGVPPHNRRSTHRIG